MNIQAHQSFQRQLYEAHKARQARFAEAARKQAAKDARAARLAATMPIWQKSPIYFNEHVTAFRNYQYHNKTCRYLLYVKRKCRELGVTLDYLKEGRASVKAKIRNEIWYELRHMDPPASLPQIGQMFERHHTTIQSGIEQHMRTL